MLLLIFEEARLLSGNIWQELSAENKRMLWIWKDLHTAL